MTSLHLSIQAEYFDAVAAGEKHEEFRLVTAYWRSRLEDRQFDRIVLKKGYPSRWDEARMLTKP